MEEGKKEEGTCKTGPSGSSQVDELAQQKNAEENITVAERYAEFLQKHAENLDMPVPKNVAKNPKVVVRAPPHHQKISDKVIEVTDHDSNDSFLHLIRNLNCCNMNCKTTENAKLLPAQPNVLQFYGIKKHRGTNHRLVCEVCNNLVAIHNENMMADLAEHRLIFHAEAPVVNETIDISDSDSSEEVETDEASLPAEDVNTINSNLEDILNTAFDKFDIRYQIKEGYDTANQDFTESKQTIHAAAAMQDETNEILDSLRENFYNTFANRDATYKNPVEIVDVIGPEGANANKCVTPSVDEQLSLLPQAVGSGMKGVAMKKVTHMPRILGSQGMLPPTSWAAHDVSLVKQIHFNNQSVPPTGPLPRPVLNPGDTMYVMKNGLFGTWIRGQISEIIPKGQSISINKPYPTTILTSCVSYRMKFQFFGKAFSIKTVNGKQMAYTTPSPVRYPVGTRVIAIYKDIDVPAGSYYAGIIAEPPKEVNKNRYLIFFDDGYTQYVAHINILLVTEASRNVYEDVHHSTRDFVKQYLEKFPERPMLKLSLDQVIKTEWNGKWWLAKVIELDCSLCNMSFLADSRTEWMYRGSTRLSPLYKLSPQNMAAPADEKKTLSKKNKLLCPAEEDTQVPSDPIQSSSPSVQECDKTGLEASSVEKDPPSLSEVSASAEMEGSAPQASASTSSVTVNRAVAKKSTSARPAYMSAGTVAGSLVPVQNKPSSFQVPGYVKHDMYTSAIHFRPKKFAPHQCGPTCTSWIPYAPDCMKHCGPLTVPLLHGWQRQLIKYRNKKAINYRAPCGRRIRNIDELSRYLRITKSLMGVDYFDFNFWVSCLAEFVVQRSFLNIKDLSYGKEYMPIPCINYVDHNYPEMMEYSATRLPVPGVFLNLDPEFLTSCDCTDGCLNKDQCSCWQLTFAGTDYGQSGVVDNTIGYSHKRLTEPVLTGIYECNSRCKCSSTCSNRVVQNPLRAKLQVFKTPRKGWGIRSINDMPQGSFICIYAGRLLNEHEANEGGKVCGDEYLAELDYIEVVERLKEGYEEQMKEYFGEPEQDSKKERRDGADENNDRRKKTKDAPNKKDLEPSESKISQAAAKARLRTRRGTTKDISRKTSVKDTSRRRKRGRQERKPPSISDDDEDSNQMSPPAKVDTDKPLVYKSIRHYFDEPDMCYIMDAKVSGNIGRYLNHSCMPNVFVQNVFVDTHDLRFPWVAFFALTFIRAGTELTWDYNYDIGSVPDKVLLCQCDSAECRGRLL